MTFCLSVCTCSKVCGTNRNVSVALSWNCSVRFYCLNSSNSIMIVAHQLTQCLWCQSVFICERAWEKGLMGPQYYDN